MEFESELISHFPPFQTVHATSDPDFVDANRGRLLRVIYLEIPAYRFNGSKSNALDSSRYDYVSHRAASKAEGTVATASGRSYLLVSSRVLVEGNVCGMYLFGYGNFSSAAGDVGITLTRHITANAGYQLGSRLNVNGTPDRVGLSLIQKGPLLAMRFSF